MKNANLIFNFKVYGKDRSKVVPVKYRDYKDLTKKIKSYKQNGIIHTIVGTGSGSSNGIPLGEVLGVYIAGSDILEIQIEFLRTELPVEEVLSEEVMI